MDASATWLKTPVLDSSVGASYRIRDQARSISIAFLAFRGANLNWVQLPLIHAAMANGGG